MNKIKIKNLQKKVKISIEKLRKIAKITLRDQRIDMVELSVVLVDSETMRDLNKKYLNHNYVTDVLAFRMNDGEFTGFNPEILGDVVVCPDTALECAFKLNESFEKEMSLYLVHGILHLLGYCDQSAVGAAEMSEIQERILSLNV